MSVVISDIWKILRIVYRLKKRQIIWQLYRRFFPITRFSKNCFCFCFCSNDFDGFDFPYVSLGNDSISVFGKPVFFVGDSLYVGPKHDYMYEYCLLYMDFLRITDLPTGKLISCMNSVREMNSSEEWRPYTVSKRIQSLIIFISHRYDLISEVDKKELYEYLTENISFLERNIEYHLDANHLLTNYASLALSSIVTEDDSLNKYRSLYIDELDRQLKDSFHYERSYAYTLQVVGEFLSILCLMPTLGDVKILGKVKQIIDVTKPNQQLLKYFGDNIVSQSIRFESIEKQLSKYCSTTEQVDNSGAGGACSIGGYTVLSNSKVKIVIDSGLPSPSFNPGHAHDSTGAIAVSFQEKVFLRSMGTSTYEVGSTRDLERSKYAYSKPVNAGDCQEVWKSFRVGRINDVIVERKKCSFLVDCKTDLGFFKRDIKFIDDCSNVFMLTDSASIARINSKFILGSSVEVIEINYARVLLKNGNVLAEIVSTGNINILRKEIMLSDDYGCLYKGSEISFESTDSDTIEFIFKFWLE